MSQIPQRHFPKDRLSQGKTQTSLHVRAIRSRATGARHRHRRESANQAFSSGNTGPQRRVEHMGDDHKTDAIFFD